MINFAITFAGQPVLVEVSVSLRNILEIDEHRQVIIFEEKQKAILSIVVLVLCTIVIWRDILLIDLVY